MPASSRRALGRRRPARRLGVFEGSATHPARDLGGVRRRQELGETCPRACLPIRGGCRRRPGARWEGAGPRAVWASSKGRQRTQRVIWAASGAARNWETCPGAPSRKAGTGSGMLVGHDVLAVVALVDPELGREAELLQLVAEGDVLGADDLLPLAVPDRPVGDIPATGGAAGLWVGAEGAEREPVGAQAADGHGGRLLACWLVA